MDFDADGLLDILSGSWPGELYFFPGEGKGRFAAGTTIPGKDGKAIRLANASTVFAHDWNGDGRLDLLVGAIEGDVYLVLNEGESRKHAFGEAHKLTAGGTAIRMNQGDSHPVVADWDSDGSPDLIVGAGDGSVHWYRNAGSRTEPKLEAGRVLLAASPNWRPGARNGENMRGVRAKVCVTDWNGDGTPDLLVGDFGLTQGPAPNLSPADREAEKQVQARASAASRELQPFYTELRKLGQPPLDAAERAAWERKYKALEARHKEPLDRLRQAQTEMRRFRPSFTYHGYVWLALGRPATVAEAR